VPGKQNNLNASSSTGGCRSWEHIAWGQIIPRILHSPTPFVKAQLTETAGDDTRLQGLKLGWLGRAALMFSGTAASAFVSVAAISSLQRGTKHQQKGLCWLKIGTFIFKQNHSFN